ncbi:ribose-phosphate pyrophosphokinase [Candidatus Woesearchaeota archaeon]|nr:ribose-phosphate pyrophosphokinase [Candidatus Woesearchaeota archaeon]
MSDAIPDEEQPAEESIQERARRFVEQQSPPNLFYYTEGARSFERRLGDAYKGLWRDHLTNGEQLLHVKHKEGIDAAAWEKIQGDVNRMQQLSYEACDSKTTPFNNGELQPSSRTNVRHRSIDLISMFRDSNVDLVELLLTLDMLNRSSASAVNVIAPFLPYQREDKKLQGKVPISAKVIFDLIAASAKHCLKRIVTIDLHAAQEEGFSDYPVDHLRASPLFARYILSDYFLDTNGLSLDDITVVSVDAGGAYRAEKAAAMIGRPYVVHDKTRSAPGTAEVRGHTGQIKTRCAVIIDDMVDTAGSITETSRYLREQDGVEKIFVFATHGVFSPKHDGGGRILYHPEDILRESGVKVVVCDTIPRSDEYYRANKDWLVDVISVAPLLADAILHDRLGYSVSQSMDRMQADIRNHVQAGRRMVIEPYLLKLPDIKPAAQPNP